MRAAVFHEFGGPLGVEEVPDPAPPADGVVLEVGATGICRSDWHAWMGHDPDVAPPHVPGHELAGTVVAVGPDVRGVRQGERVTVPFCLGCGRCAPCLAGETQICDDDYQPGFTGWGSFARYVALPHAELNLVRLPDGLGFVEAAALGCRFMTAFAAVTVHGRPRAGDWVAVHGCGGVRVISHELELAGVHGMAVRHYPGLLDAITAGRLDPARLVGATVALEQAGDELAAMGGFARQGATVVTSF